MSKILSLKKQSMILSEITNRLDAHCSSEVFIIRERIQQCIDDYVKNRHASFLKKQKAEIEMMKMLAFGHDDTEDNIVEKSRWIKRIKMIEFEIPLKEWTIAEKKIQIKKFSSKGLEFSSIYDFLIHFYKTENDEWVKFYLVSLIIIISDNNFNEIRTNIEILGTIFEFSGRKYSIISIENFIISFINRIYALHHST